MSHQLFTELTPEQQEIVSGGADFSDTIKTDFTELWQVLDATVGSSTHGSGVSQKFAFNKVKTSASKEISFFPAGW